MQPFDGVQGVETSCHRRETANGPPPARPPEGCHFCTPNKHQLRLLDHRSLRCIARPLLPNHGASVQTMDELL
jgi:hypothetical protein